MSVVDFFSGCGGTSLGFRDAGLDIALGVDNDPHAAETFRRNFPEALFLEADVRGLDETALGSLLPDAPLLFSGCAPCQPFSRQNNARSPDDHRRGLLGEFTRMVLAHRPRYVVVENVPGMQSVADGQPLTRFVAALKSAGYESKVQVLKALDYGVPQQRRRLVVVAALGRPPRLPEPTHGPGRLPVVTVADVIAGLPALEAGEVDPDDPDHVASALSETNRRRIRATPEGGDRRDWPPGLELDCHSRHGGHTDAYGRMSWDRPASGLTTRCVSYSNGRFGHPAQDRAISVREAACLQTFPRSFAFAGTMTARAKQIGNAVPPLMARRIAEAALGRATP